MSENANRFIYERMNQPPRNFFAITPSDSTDLTYSCRQIHCNTSGTVKAIGVGDSVAVSFVVVAGCVYPKALKRVLSTGTTPGISLIGEY